MLIFLAVAFVVALAVYLFLQTLPFGRKPRTERLGRIVQAPNTQGKTFQNIHETPAIAPGVSYFSVLGNFIFKKNKQQKPPSVLPSVKTDLLRLKPEAEVLIWFGHSGYFLQTAGLKFLIDPVFSGSASPLPGSVKSFAGSDVYDVKDMPRLDYLVLTHDHWDHLDYKTIVQLLHKTEQVICPLGVGAHLERWGFAQQKITELNWHETSTLKFGCTITAAPARHFSGRGFIRNQTLWTSYALQTPAKNMYLGGDSGYDTHFAEIGNTLGPFDFAILECGQYDDAWPFIHMHPPQVLQAAADLKTAKLLPVHWGKFSLANHDWDTPIRTLLLSENPQNIEIVTPKIGEVILLDEAQQFERWWEAV